MKTERLSKTQLPVLASYSSLFILLSAIAINLWLAGSGRPYAELRLFLLSASFPIGLGIGRLIYLRRSHVTVTFDDESFRVVKGRKQVADGNWKAYRFVSLVLDQFGRADLRLYKTLDGEHQDLPISKTNAKPQEFRDLVQKSLISAKKAPRGTFDESNPAEGDRRISPQAVATS